jgi:hypothetical protein
MRRFAIARIIGLLLALMGIGLSAWFAREAIRLNAEFHQWLVARPMEADMDLSQPGETTVRFHQTCSISHGEALYVDANLDDAAQQNLEELLDGLFGSVVIKERAGTEIESAMFSNTTAHWWGGKLMLTDFAPFQKGDYFATITIESGAPALAGKLLTVYAQYQLCGLEQMPAMITGVFAVGAGVVGLVSAMCVLPGLLRNGFWRDVPAHTDSIVRE